MFYVYRFLNSKKEIIYVGKSKNLTNRLYAHFNNQQKDWMGEICFIEVAKFQDGATMSIYELYYIDLFKPKYNRDGVYNDSLTSIELPSVNFSVYEFNYEFVKNIENSNNNKPNINKDILLKSFTLILNKEMDLSVSDSMMSLETLNRIGKTMKNIKNRFNPNISDGDLKISISYSNIIPLSEVDKNPYKRLNRMYISKIIRDEKFKVVLYIHPKSKNDVDDIIYFMQNNVTHTKRFIYIPDKTLAKYVMEYFDYKIDILRVK